MRKDIEWLVQMIDSERESLRKRFESGKGTHNETTFNEGMGWALSKVLKMIYQLDKPEALSQELPVIPKYVAEWIEEYRKVYEDKFFIIGYDLYDGAIHLAVGDWIVDNQEKFVKAWFDGYEVKKEKRYYVNLDSSAYVAKWKEDGQVNIYTDAIFGSDEFEFFLTEQEIKNFDDRFWAFAEPAEQWN